MGNFNEAVLDDRTKQMIGHMVGQTMQHDGYEADQHNVMIGSVPFCEGTGFTPRSAA